MAENGVSRSCGAQVSFSGDLSLAVHSLVSSGPFAFVVTPLVHPRLHRHGAGQARQQLREFPLTRSDLILESRTWSQHVVGQLSEWIECDASSAGQREAGCKALSEELQWASHIGLCAVVLPCPRTHCANLGATLSRSSYSGTVWVSIPLVSEPAGTSTPEGSWLGWNRLRTLCGGNGGNVSQSLSLGVMLDVGASLPSYSSVMRWTGEPVRAIRLHASIFLSNAKGFPVLSQAHQEVVVHFHKHGAQIVLAGKGGSHPLPVYQQYVQHLLSRIPAPTEKDNFESPFYDYLQSPLQPLGDNLESQMYETFEKDPVKYAKYEEATALALRRTAKDKVSVVMVVGAGRGPLVRCALRAAEQEQRKVRMYAIEKNPNACITLRNMKSMLGWGDRVKVIETDMRVWQPPELADILISELLGSWGDNELSPECLDGAERLLNPVGGVSIPYEYTSFVQPICTTRLWADARAFDDVKHLETMYVCKLRSFFAFDHVKPVFTFAHPSWHKGVSPETGEEEFSAAGLVEAKRPIDNSRFRRLQFTAQQAGVMHGFGAYFEAKLFEDVMISINPPTVSQGMFSWFPIYIPLRQPVQLSRGDTISCMFWRQCRSTRVWYEWALDSPVVTPIHNANGVSQPINLVTD